MGYSVGSALAPTLLYIDITYDAAGLDITDSQDTVLIGKSPSQEREKLLRSIPQRYLNKILWLGFVASPPMTLKQCSE